MSIFLSLWGMAKPHTLLVEPMLFLSGYLLCQTPGTVFHCKSVVNMCLINYLWECSRWAATWWQRKQREAYVFLLAGDSMRLTYMVWWFSDPWLKRKELLVGPCCMAVRFSQSFWILYLTMMPLWELKSIWPQIKTQLLNWISQRIPPKNL